MLYILIPAFNEEKDLPGLLDSVINQKWDFKYQLVLVNDGSTDKTAEIAASYKDKLPLNILTHAKNQGLGKTLLTGLAEINKSITNEDTVITIDADQTHPLELVRDMKQTIESGYDAVIASRFCTGGGQSGVPAYRMLLSNSASAIFRIIKPISGVKDYTSGYRAFSGKVVRRLFDKYKDKVITETGFTAAFELLLKTSTLTGKITELPLSLHYERKMGISKMKILKTVSRYLLLIFAVSLRNLFHIEK